MLLKQNSPSLIQIKKKKKNELHANQLKKKEREQSNQFI